MRNSNSTPDTFRISAPISGMVLFAVLITGANKTDSVKACTMMQAIAKMQYSLDEGARWFDVPHTIR